MTTIFQCTVHDPQTGDNFDAGTGFDTKREAEEHRRFLEAMVPGAKVRIVEREAKE